jgi:hypothetical protein
MQSIHESNQRRFRIILLSSLLVAVWVTAVFGGRIRKAFTEQTAGLAKVYCLYYLYYLYYLCYLYYLYYLYLYYLYYLNYLYHLYHLYFLYFLYLYYIQETLENESLKVQTQELATAVVNTILEDKEITSQAAAFLKEASTAPETQQALLELTLHVLQHPETLEELSNITQKMIKNLADDKVRVCRVVEW